MLFQTLDNKNECAGIYLNNQIIYDVENLDNLSHTWSYSDFLKGKEINYANLYCDGKSLEEVCPENLKADLENINKKLKAFINSFIQAKVSLKENCFFDLTPKKFLIQYCNIKNKICEEIFNKVKKPKQYSFYRRFNELLKDIEKKDLNIDLHNMHNKLYKDSASNFYKKISVNNKNISYNMFGSITGRLTVEKDSFPILTFPKGYRNILKPKNDWFISFDMNAAELRTALALAGKPQMDGDLHQWSAENIFKNSLNRAEAKATATSWLYDSQSALASKHNSELSNLYQKDLLLNKYWTNGIVSTPYDRYIEADKHHAISYLNQSTFIDLYHRQIIKVDDFLKSNKSYVSFLIHDEFVLDMSDDEKEKIIDIIKILQDTPYGKFPVNVKAGKNFGDMKKLNLKV